ncbi:hypothetical protein K435DRAFT_796595 [Dendrothele bispora CBS 962.96]|uniref:Uncharacterized protein n=1 Tax=Dendrothele bispora (strain CBS 962.96) TaxID=1314807 RepID=A0A4S8M5M1_DENBC|nr:hypothetical protein K435DRAFT_796595 [Dendrothele bispora CBS 962.96]
MIDLLPVRQLWENGTAIIRCYIAHRILHQRKDIQPLVSYDYFLSLGKTIFDTWSITFLQPDTGLFCVSPTHSFRDGGDKPYFGWEDPKEPALSPLPVASYDDSYILSHYLNWARGNISAELAFQKDISFGSSSFPYFDHNPKQPVSLVVITSTAPLTTTPTIIGKFKNLQYRVVDAQLLHPSSIQNTQDMFQTTDKVEVTILMTKWWVVGERFVGQKNEPSSEIDLKGWTRVPCDHLWSYSSGRCPHLDHRQLTGFSRLIHIFWNGNSLTASWLSQAQYFCDTVNGLYKDIPESADACWGNDDNDLYYWSFNPDGSCPLSKRVTEALGLPEFLPRAQLVLERFADYQYEATKQFQLFRGYNPSTQEFAKRHGLPLLDIIWPDDKTGPGMGISDPTALQNL